MLGRDFFQLFTQFDIDVQGFLHDGRHIHSEVFGLFGLHPFFFGFQLA